MNAPHAVIDDLFLEHRPTIVKVLFHMVGCYQTAEDLSQEAYLKVSAAIRKGPIAYPRPFLYQTAKNLALDHLRKQKVRGRAFDDPDDGDEVLQVADVLPGPERSATIAQEVDRLLAILAGQPRRRREILVLHKIHGWRYDEIAAYFGISRSAVEKNIRTALAHCLSASKKSNAE